MTSETNTYHQLAASFLETAVLAVEQGLEPAAYENALHALTISIRGAVHASGGNAAHDHLAGEFARHYRDRVPPLVLRQITSFLEDVDAPLDPAWSGLPSDELHHRVTRIGELVTDFVPQIVGDREE